MGWWTDPVGGKKTVRTTAKPRQTKRSWLAQPVGGDKCPICNKRMGRCSHTKQQMAAVKEKVKKTVQVKGKDGTVRPQQRTVTRNAGYSEKDGILWCDTCGYRVLIGTMSGQAKCSNVTCSTRGGNK
jgi:hypothetical protein